MGTRSGSQHFGVGIVGLGDGGMSNLRSLQAFNDVEVVALCDINPERLDSAAAELGAPAARYPKSAELVADPAVKLVIVATPDDQHLEIAVQALEAGRCVFPEKPVATSMDDLKVFRQLIRTYPGMIIGGEKYSHASPVEAALARRERQGRVRWGTKLYTMWRCGLIMGPEGWRVHSVYNPAAGGLAHNFMTARLFADGRIVRVRATGRVLTYRELKRHGGFDTMEGALEFADGTTLNWVVCLAVEGVASPFRHRTIAHTFQFDNGALVYGPAPDGDRLYVGDEEIRFILEPPAGEAWARYNTGKLYGGMHANIVASIRDGRKLRHPIDHGINVAAACVLAFESAHQDGAWIEVPF